ncbi:MAG TPA: phage baseplate assembly protein V [Longimicrobium sp.]|uniref:phage baseplate assembly protein V n=1 Tax=Longimicrobium sp. TaxID=2029185 RepID=UPI002ED831EF
MSAGPRADGPGRAFGLYPAIVTDVVDPQRLGRIEVSLPYLGADGSEVRAWATLLTPYADDDQGFLALPAVDTQVIVGFEAGDPRRPYIVGSCWNGREALPETPASPNNKRLIKSRAGSLLEFDDTDGAAKVTVSMKSGHKLVLDDGAQQVTLSHANGCTVTMDASGNVKITANMNVDVTASVLNVHAPVANFDGVVNCTTMNATVGVVSPSYTPGIGNVW